MRLNKWVHTGIIGLLGCLLVSCQPANTPKPRAYFRIALPEKAYHQAELELPAVLRIPDYSQLTRYAGNAPIEKQSDHWINLRFPDFNGTLHLTYVPVDENLNKLIDDAHEFAYKHTVVADAIAQTEFFHPENDVYGLLFDIKGNTASSVQFYATDSTKHFLRGSLYFDSEPNEDSLAPVINFIRKDITYLMESLEWLY